MPLLRKDARMDINLKLALRGPATWVFTDSDLAALVFEMKGMNDE